MQLKNKIAIVVIVYNNSTFLRKQVECIRRFCEDSHDIIIIDNSSIESVIESVKYHSGDLGCTYMKTQSSSQNGSSSHAFACNASYWKYHGQYKYFLYLDHDNFPVKKFSVEKILKDKVMAGLWQIRADKEYFWAGCVMWDDEKVESELIDFSPNNDFKLDTGGNLYKVIEKHGRDSCLFFDEVHVQNPQFNKSFYNFYSMILNSTFMHFINGSNWAKANDNQERINSLLNVLEEKIST